MDELTPWINKAGLLAPCQSSWSEIGGQKAQQISHGDPKILHVIIIVGYMVAIGLLTVCWAGIGWTLINK
jgi:hypothetical protein